MEVIMETNGMKVDNNYLKTLSDEFELDSLDIGKKSAKLSEIIQALEKIYCGTLGIEYNYISSLNERKWFQKRLEPNLGNLEFNPAEQKYGARPIPRKNSRCHF